MLRHILKASLVVMTFVPILLSSYGSKADEVWNMATAWGGGPILEVES